MALLQGNVVGTGLPNLSAGAQNISAGMDRQSALLVSELNGRYSGLSRAGNLFFAHAIVTASVIYSTAAGTGGPLLYNGLGSGVVVQLLAAGFGVTTAATAAGAVGITGGTGQTVVPTSTTAIDGSGNCFFGGAVSKISAYRVGTVATAGAFLIPIGDVGTGALTVMDGKLQFVDLGGIITFGPGGWASLAASATLTTAVMTMGLLWAEIPV